MERLTVDRVPGFSRTCLGVLADVVIACPLPELSEAEAVAMMKSHVLAPEQAENAALRRQLIVLQDQRSPVLPPIVSGFPSIVKAMTTIRPETLVRWHRAGFRRYWRWKSRNLGAGHQSMPVYVR